MEIIKSMYDKIQFVYKQMGYKTLKTNLSEPHVNIKFTKNSDEDIEGYVIVTIDETSGVKYTSEQFSHISQQIRNFVMSKGCSLYHFLYIIISNDNNAAHRLLGEHEQYWRIIPAESKLMVYETANQMFLGLRRPIEQLLETSTSNNTELSAVQAHHKFAVVNAAIIMINIIIFILTDFIDLSLNGASPVDKGSLSWDMVLNHHQFYRLFTCMFLHAGIDHIFNNMLVLFFIGNYVEQYTGRIRYLIIYFSSGIIAGCTSMVYNMMQYDYTESIGASGAIFGIMGALLCILLFRHSHEHNLDLRRVAFMVLLSLYGGFTSQGVDNAAHIGGFLGGILVTTLLFSITYISKRKAGTY